ncbi:MAG: sugar ABC transporter permease [Chloroflexota bacterium]|nr:MAG: sugar ABC transporter permease [Chloroflexota bacterium]
MARPSTLAEAPPSAGAASKPAGVLDFFDRTFKYWAVLPTVIVLTLLTIQPALQLIQMSVSDVQFSGGQLQWTFVGLDNFKYLATDVVFPVALRNTLIFVVCVVVIETFLGLVLAFAVSRVGRFSPIYRAVFVTPILIPAVAIGTMWRLMYDYNFGIINQILALFGIAGPTWTGDPNLALISVMIVDIWHWTSFLFLILLAGVESLPHELSEAARVDGANEWQVYRHVLLPMMRPTIIVALMLRTILAFKVFDEIFLLTGGGPGTASQVISMHIYTVFFEQFRLGYGALLALLMALIISVFVIFYQWVNAMARKTM